MAGRGNCKHSLFIDRLRRRRTSVEHCMSSLRDRSPEGIRWLPWQEDELTTGSEENSLIWDLAFSDTFVPPLWKAVVSPTFPIFNRLDIADLQRFCL